MIVLSDRWVVSPSYSGYEVSDTGLVRNIKTKHILTFNTKKGGLSLPTCTPLR